MKTKGIGEARWPSATRNQFQSSLPNGKIELISFAAALAPKGTVQLMNEMNGLLFSRREVGELGLLSSSALFGGLWAQAAPRQLAQRRDERRKKANSARLFFLFLLHFISFL